MARLVFPRFRSSPLLNEKYPFSLHCASVYSFPFPLCPRVLLSQFRSDNSLHTLRPRPSFSDSAIFRRFPLVGKAAPPMDTLDRHLGLSFRWHSTAHQVPRRRRRPTTFLPCHRSVPSLFFYGSRRSHTILGFTLPLVCCFSRPYRTKVFSFSLWPYFSCPS